MIFNYDASFGRFIKRPNRFIAHMNLDGKEVICHVPNTGRLKELLLPGVRVMMSYHPSKHRKTKYELRMIMKDNMWFSIDSQLPNALAFEAITHGVIDELKGYSEIKREVRYENSRFDLQLIKKAEHSSNKTSYKDICFVEVKGVTLEKDGWSYFPDAPISRGRKHIDELIHAVENGYRGVLLFVIQFENAQGFSPNTEMDPAFSKALHDASLAGVEILAYGCKVSTKEVTIVNKVPILIA